MMVKAPKEITACDLSVIVMPNGEVICRGITGGWIKDLGQFLTAKKVKR